MKLEAQFRLELILQAVIVLGCILIGIKYHSYWLGIIALLISQVVINYDN